MPIQHEPVDVVVIGAGMGGAAFCYQLSRRAPQLRIACLERGDWLHPAQMPATRRDFQQLALSSWALAPSVRAQYPTGGATYASAPSPSADYRVDDSASAIKPLMWCGVGGSSLTWAAHFPRLHPSDFNTYTLDGVGDDWPFSYFDLEPYYDQNDTIMGVSGLAGDPAYPPKRAPRMPPLPIGRMGEKAAQGFNRLGWHWWPVDAAINSVARDGRPGCNHCGPCQQGCVIQAKASVDQTYWPGALAQGVELRTRCVTQEILAQAGRATGVRYTDGAGQEHRQPAAYVVVAANGIGTPRLLLASGLGGAMVGRCLMFHPVAYIRAICHEALDGPAGAIGCAIYSHEFYETARPRGFVRGFQLQVTRENPLLTQSTYAEPRWGQAGQQQLREEFRHSFRVMVVSEDLPELHNRVTITDQIETDGLPQAKLEYTIAENTQRMLTYGLERAQEMLQAAGVARMVPTAYAPLTGWHLLGTARMGRDPHTSVTDAQGRCHTTPNLIIADGSLLPTVGAVNPGSTIGALALKIADDLAREVGA